MTCPSKKSALVVRIQGLDSEAGEKAAGRYVVANGMGYVDPTHGAHTAMVKAA